MSVYDIEFSDFTGATVANHENTETSIGFFPTTDFQALSRNLVIIKSFYQEGQWLLHSPENPLVDLRDNTNFPSSMNLQNTDLIRKTPSNHTEYLKNHSSYDPNNLLPSLNFGLTYKNYDMQVRLNAETIVNIESSNTDLECSVCENGLNLNPESFFRNTQCKVTTGVGGRMCYCITVINSLINTNNIPTQLYDYASLTNNENFYTKIFPEALTGRIICVEGSFTCNEMTVLADQYIEYDPTVASVITSTSDRTLLAFMAFYGEY